MKKFKNIFKKNLERGEIRIMNFSPQEQYPFCGYYFKLTDSEPTHCEQEATGDFTGFEIQNIEDLDNLNIGGFYGIEIVTEEGYASAECVFEEKTPEEVQEIIDELMEQIHKSFIEREQKENARQKREEYLANEEQKTQEIINKKWSQWVGDLKSFYHKWVKKNFNYGGIYYNEDGSATIQIWSDRYTNCLLDIEIRG